MYKRKYKHKTKGKKRDMKTVGIFLGIIIVFFAVGYAAVSFLQTPIGNIIDRVVHGYVIDFIKIGDFPVFNLADSMITLAGILFIIYYKKIVIK